MLEDDQKIKSSIVFSILPHLAAIIGFVLLFLYSVIFLGISNLYSKPGDIILYAAPAVIVYLIFIFIYHIIVNNPKELIDNFERLSKKFENSANSLVQEKRFIPNDLLTMIEGEAKDIWVITTSLQNEANAGDIQEGVKRNLESGTNYTYLLPDLSLKQFGNIRANYEAFIKLDFVEQNRERVKIVHLPVETIFLLEEVVIFNPGDRPVESSYLGLNGFTYYKSANQSEDTLHMKIDGHMLQNICDTLKLIIEEHDLGVKIETIFDSCSDLTTEGKAYLVDFQRIVEKRENVSYSEFISELHKGNCSKASIELIGSQLKHYVG